MNRTKKEIKKELYEIQNGYCSDCNEHFESRNMELDHKIPRWRGGTDKKDNLQLLCRSCKDMKQDWQKMRSIERKALEKSGAIEKNKVREHGKNRKNGGNMKFWGIVVLVVIFVGIIGTQVDNADTDTDADKTNTESPTENKTTPKVISTKYTLTLNKEGFGNYERKDYKSMADCLEGFAEYIAKEWNLGYVTHGLDNVSCSNLETNEFRNYNKRELDRIWASLY